jgi:ParB/RepB/Spo0J family partition protein
VSFDHPDLPLAVAANGSGHPLVADPPPTVSRNPGEPAKNDTGDKIPITRFARPKHDIRPDRKHEDIERLSENMLQHGQLVPVLAFLRADDKLEIIDGYTRYLAALRAGIEFLYARILDKEPEYTEKLAMQLIGNDLHTGMNVVERAAVYAELLAKGLNQSKIAALFTCSEADIARVLGIHRNACPELREAVLKNLVVPKAAYFLSRTSPEQQKALMTEGIAGNWTTETYESRVRSTLGGKPKKSKPVTVKRDGATVAFPGDWTVERMAKWLAAMLEATNQLVKLKLPTTNLGAMLKS